MMFFFNREPWAQNASILKKKGNKYLQQAQQEVSKQRKEKDAKRPKDQKAKKTNKTELSKQLQGLQPEQDGWMKTCFDPNEMF
jgi:hypothetical protein